MRNLVIQRKRAFPGCLLTFICVLNMSPALYSGEYRDYYNSIPENLPDTWREPEDFAPSVSQHLIKNGQKISIPISESDCTLFIAKGAYYSNQLTIEEGNEDVFCVVKTQGSIRGILLSAIGMRKKIMRIRLERQ